MNSKEKRHAGEGVASSRQPRVEPETSQVQPQGIGPTGRPTLHEFPGSWYWTQCANAQLRILATKPEPHVQGVAMWRYCICLALMHGGMQRWTGYAASVIQGHASSARGSRRWRIGYLQGLVDFASVWVPLTISEFAREEDRAEILQVESNQS